MWPIYGAQCRKDVDELLQKGGSLSAYRASPSFPEWKGPSEGSWAWRVERDIEKRFRVKHAIATNSGTAALHAGLHSLGLGRGDEVVTSPYTFSATAAAIIHAGGVPVFADVDPHTYCITKETVKRVATKRTKAILPVHLFGGVQSLEPLREFDVPIIEDACQAVGARAGGVYSGCSGVAGAYSFNGSKNLPAGEGGALVTNDSEVAAEARLLGNHGENFGGHGVGWNYRPNEVTSCIAWHGLQELEERNIKRHIFADKLTRLLYESEIFRLPQFYCCTREEGQEHVWYVYPFQVKPGTRDAFLERLKVKGVACGGGYITPTLDKYPAFEKHVTGPLSVVHELSEKTLCLLYDVYHEEPEREATRVAQAILESL